MKQVKQREKNSIDTLHDVVKDESVTTFEPPLFQGLHLSMKTEEKREDARVENGSISGSQARQKQAFWEMLSDFGIKPQQR